MFSSVEVCHLMVRHYTSCEIVSCLAASVSRTLCLQVRLPFISEIQFTLEPDWVILICSSPVFMLYE